MSNVWETTKNDEYYTPKVFVKPIIKYLKKGSYILCPFDTDKSEFVIELKNAGFKVDFSHIASKNNKKDFFTYTKDEVQKYDYIISNPPFSLKKQVFRKLREFNKPYAMVLGIQALGIDGFMRELINNEPQLLCFDKRISFNGNHSTFTSAYFCKGILPRDFIVDTLENDNTGKNFVPSAMYGEELEDKQKKFDF